MRALIVGHFPESLCSACQRGQAHTLSIHAKLLRADMIAAPARAPVVHQDATDEPPASDPRPNVRAPKPPPQRPPQGGAVAFVPRVVREVEEVF